MFDVMEYRNIDTGFFKFFYNTINQKQILTKYYNHQEHTYCYLGSCNNTMLEQKLMEQITEIKILKDKIKIKQNNKK